MVTLNDVQELKKLLRDKKWDEAISRLYERLESIQGYMEGYKNNNTQAAVEYGGIMQILAQAIECGDAILLCDIIEYELFPFTNTYITKSEE